ncbi:MAG: protein TolR [Mangrovicoccus sp.]|nr:protein TolR [Mangrovicoccus sp.]
MGMGVPQGRRSTGRRRQRGHGLAPMAEINVTPFVDVMLVLLIIFMVAAPLLTSGVPVDLPESAASALPAEEEPPLTISLAEDGRIYLQEAEIAAEQLLTRLSAIAGERRDRQIYLRADGALSYAQVMGVMGDLSAAGFSAIGLVTENSPLPVPVEGEEAGQ